MQWADLPTMAHHNHPKFIPQILHLVNLNKSSNGIDVVQSIHNIRVISVEHTK